MAGWIGFGVLVAAAAIVSAVMFGPETETVAEHPGDDSQIAAPETPETAAAPATASVPAVPADPTLAEVSVVRLRVGPDFPPERQAALVDALTAAGIASVKVEQLPFKITASRVGYYRQEDLAAAEALGRVMSPAVSPNASLGVRDYGRLLADPEPGRLDLWVGG